MSVGGSVGEGTAWGASTTAVGSLPEVPGDENVHDGLPPQPAVLVALQGFARRFEAELHQHCGEIAEHRRVGADVQGHVGVFGRPDERGFALDGVKVDGLAANQHPAVGHCLVDLEHRLPGFLLFGEHGGQLNRNGCLQ